MGLNYAFMCLNQRADPRYERGAWKFVRCVGADLAECELIICPCIDCRNVDCHSADVVVDYLVSRGMDLSYKLREDQYHHGEVISGLTVETMQVRGTKRF